MSLSNPKIQNPATKFIEFKGESGKFQYYDKEKEENIQLELPFYFIVLDELSTIRGYNRDYNCGVYSNEVNRMDEILNVRTFKGSIQIVGKYADIKGKIIEIGGQFSKSVYAAFIHDRNNIELVNFQFSGASRNPWFELKIDKTKFGICVKETIEDKNGKTIFMRPVFESCKIGHDVFNKAVEMDKKLQAYLKQYKEQFKEELEKVELTEVDETPTEFEQRTTTQEIVETLNPETEKEENLNKTDDLPF